MDLHINHLGEVDLKDLRGSYGTETGRLHGDFYCEPDDVVRGAQLSSTHDFVFGQGSGYLAHEGKTCTGAGFPEDAFATPLAEGHLLHDPPRASARFSDQAGLPAPLPCQAAVTSIAIEDASPADVATFVHAFLTTSVRAVVTKVCPQKFAMKAEVFHDVAGCPLSCALKARVFQARGAPCEESRLVVEFQRRAGDSLAFNGVFRLARGALLRRFAAAEPQRALAAGPEDEDRGWAPVGATEVRPEDLQPLLDMLVNHSSVTQAEAVAALVALASAGAAGAHAVCRLLADFGGVLRTLLGSDQLQVSFPAARLVSTLARNADRSEVAPILHCVDVCPGLAHPAVRSELAEVLA